MVLHLVTTLPRLSIICLWTCVCVRTLSCLLSCLCGFTQKPTFVNKNDAAIEQVKHQDWFKQCEVWLYRGAWQEWEPEKIEMAVPISPEEMLRKRTAIFKHQSQKDRAMFPGSDKREFWQRAEDRNIGTAKTYDDLVKKLKSFSPRTITQKSEFALWNLPWMLAAAIFFFAVEWFVRKRSGMV